MIWAFRYLHGLFRGFGWSVLAHIHMQDFLFHSQFWCFQLILSTFRFGHQIFQLWFQGFLWSVWALIRTTCRIFDFIACSGVFSSFSAPLDLGIKNFNFDFKRFPWSLWAHMRTMCTIFNFIATSGVLSLFWALLVVGIKLFNLDSFGPFWLIFKPMAPTVLKRLTFTKFSDEKKKCIYWENRTYDLPGMLLRKVMKS